MKDNRALKTITPIDGSVLLERPLATERDIDTALASAVAAQRNGRHYIVGDINLSYIELTKQRLAETWQSSELIHF